MKNLKKALAVLLTVCLLVMAFAGCASEPQQSQGSEQSQQQSGYHCDHCQDQRILYDLIHYFSPPFPNGLGRVAFSIRGTSRLLMMIA